MSLKELLKNYSNTDSCTNRVHCHTATFVCVAERIILSHPDGQITPLRSVVFEVQLGRDGYRLQDVPVTAGHLTRTETF